MTTIDTSLYLDGALRLAQHGAGKGGNVLMHIDSGEQTEISDEGVKRIDAAIENISKRHFGAHRADAVFHHMERYYPA